MAADEKCFILCACLITWFFGVSADVICENGFCRSYMLDSKCPMTAPDCSYNNATHSGLTLPSPTICNCCPYCLPLYGESHPCSVGGISSGITVGRCGDGLACDQKTLTCVRMKTKCHDAQDDYDNRHANGLTGALESRPSCDGKGNYASFYCVPSQTCFCQSEDGERLFGEVVFTGRFQNMPCKCSRMAHKIKMMIENDVPFPVFGLRCTSDGNFNPVQCLGRVCYCVNVITGEARNNEKIDLDKKPISDLPCYNPNFDLFPIPPNSEPPYNYTTPCFESINEREKLIEQSIEEGYDVDYFSTFNSLSCLPDGTFSRTMINSNGSKICIDEHRQPIDDFAAAPYTSTFNNMDCKCAITSSLMNSSIENPQCCKNGNFRPIQCRRGKCHCVDSDGRQLGKENSDVTRLLCYTTDWRNC